MADENFAGSRRCAACCLGLLLVGLIGCFQAPAPSAPPTAIAGKSSDPPASESAPSDLPAGEILKRMLAVYRQAASYEDQGIVRLEFVQAGQKTGDEWPCAVRFERPNKLSLVAFQATVKCDGREFKARIDDPPTHDLDGQMLVRPAPQELHLTDLASDPLLYDIVSSRLRRQPIQLELLLESGGLAAAFGTDIACQRLEPGQTDGRDCFRVEVPSPGGAFVFWVDRAGYVLRRLDYPAAALLPDLASDPSVSELRLSAELKGAKIGGNVSDDQFALDVPAAVKRMKTFAMPPQPLPSELFGQEPGEFFFTDLAGAKIDAVKLSGRVAVLVWYHDNPACQATLEQVATAQTRLKDDDAVAFYAVATDPTSSSNDELARRLAAWKVELPIVRDLEAFGDKAFRIEVQPTVVVLDEKGRVQIFQAGGNPQLADQIVQIVERLKMGTDLAAEILAQHQRERKQYDELVAQGGPEPGQIVEIPEAVIRARSQPRVLKLSQLWTCRDLKSPGNLLLVEEASQPTRLFVVEGWRTMTELGHDGQVIARHALDLPERAAITYARTATDKTGNRYFAAAAPLAPQFFLLDEAWKLRRTFPAAEQTPLQLTDLAFADVNEADGNPEILAANVGEIGLVAFDLQGQVAWRNRALANVLSVAPSRPDDFGSWAIYLAGDRGTVQRINRFGHDEPPLKVGNWPLARLVPAHFPAGKQAVFLGLATNAKGEPLAVGVTAALKEAWNYPLPQGVHQRPIEAVTSSNLLPGRQGEWWLAGPDGSIHIVSEDGELHDSFYYGAALTGLAATKLGERSVLLVATDEGVAAWEIE